MLLNSSSNVVSSYIIVTVNNILKDVTHHLIVVLGAGILAAQQRVGEVLVPPLLVPGQTARWVTQS